MVLEKTLESPVDCKEIKPVNPKGHQSRIFIGRTDGAAENEMVGWHHQFNGHEFEQALGDGEGQGSLVCCRPWGRKDSDTTERLNNNNLFNGASLVAQMVKVKNLPTCRVLGLISGSQRSSGEGNGNPLQYSCLENSMDRGA